MRKFIIVKDEKESFTKSKCDCKMCKEMQCINRMMLEQKQICKNK